MPLDFCVVMLMIGGLFSFIFLLGFMVDKDNAPPLILVIPFSLMFIFGLFTTILYSVADEQVEYGIHIQPRSIYNGAQYIEFKNPDKDKPTIVNVNQMFGRSFKEFEYIHVTMFKKGPYNGIYNRPLPRIEVKQPKRQPEKLPGDQKRPC